MTGRPGARPSGAAACRLLLAALLLIVAGLAAVPAAARDDPTYVTSGELLERALATLFEKIGREPKVSMVLVEPALITVLTQGETEPHHTDEWTISRFKYLWFDSDSVSGPAPHQSDGIVPEAENSFFDLSATNIADLEKIVRRAIGYAKMESRPSVTSLRVSRTIQMVPERAYGAVEWQISLSSGQENATVHCDAAGQVTGGDLSGTTRARNADLHASDDWPAKEVQAQLAAEIGDTAIVHEVSILRAGVRVRAENPTSRDLLREFSWDYSGVHHGALEIPNPLSSGSGRLEPFALAEIDLAALPAIKRAARRAFGSETAHITAIDARKPSATGGESIVRWRVEFEDQNGARGHVELDAEGKLMETVKPKGETTSPPL